MDFLESVQSRFQKYHKKNNIIENRQIRTEHHKITQRELRLQKMDERRNLQDAITPMSLRIRPESPKKPSSPYVDRLTKLKIWKRERDRKVQTLKSTKKPTFKVGVAKDCGFPVLGPDPTSFAPKNHVFKAPNNVKPIKIKKIYENIPQRITRSRKPVASPPLPLPVPIRRQPTRGKEKKPQKENKPEQEIKQNTKIESKFKVLKRQNAIDGTPGRRKSHRKSLVARENIQEEKKIVENDKQSKKIKEKKKPPMKTPENNKENKKTPAKTNQKTPNNNNKSILNNITPENKGAYISPFVTTSRGKGSIRKENLNRSFKGLPNYKESESETGAAYFYTVLSNEITRLEGMCDIWAAYKEMETKLSEDAIDMIDVAVGQAKLLISKKFKQFEGLIISCQTGVGQEKEVTVEDLQGFWDMIYMQVENLNQRFRRLTTMKDNNWEEIAPVTKPKVVKKKAAPKTTKSAASSGIRAAILAARKKKQETNQPVEENEKEKEEAVFNGGFFVVRTPHKNTPTKHTPKITPKSILKNKKKSMVSMNKSVLFKDEDSGSEQEPEVELNTTFEKTPAKKEKRRSNRK